MTSPAPSEPSIKPRISVVIPVFNGERYIAETLQTVLNQNSAPLEIIVVDDGSVDGTADIVRRYKSQGCISYVRQDNQGPSAARNLGVSLAEGDWIAFLDADDIWYPIKLEVHCQYINSYPDVVFFWSDMDHVDQWGCPTQTVKHSHPFAETVFHRSVSPLPSSVVMQRATFHQTGGFKTTLHSYEDFEFFARVVDRFPVRFVPQSLMKRRCHSRQIHISLLRASESWPVANESLAELWRDNPKLLAVLRNYSASVYARVGKHFLRAGNLHGARYYFRESFLQKPLLWRNLRRWALSYLPGIRMIYQHTKGHAIRL